jgi:hypothetical protein
MALGFKKSALKYLQTHIRFCVFCRSYEAKKSVKTLIFAKLFCNSTMRLKIILPILMLSGLWYACEDPLEFDTAEPTIGAVLVNGSATDLIAAEGDTLNFVMSFEDDKGLDKYRIQIIEDFTPVAGIVPWNHTDVVPLDGVLTASETASVVIPAGTLAGYFSLNVEAMDLEGNVSTSNLRSLTVTSTGQPVISMFSPDFVNGVTVNPGDTIEMQGNVTDDESIYQVNVEISQEDARFFYYQFNSPDTFQFWSFDTLAVDSNFVNLPTTANPGRYDLSILAFDRLGNLTRKSTSLQVQ